jgi:DNA-directed RNA polymerase specialized sigma24 family protein
MNKTKGAKRSKTSGGTSSCEDAFEALPPLGTDTYVRHIETAETSALPPEVLARAFRQLPPGCEASRATLNRLVRKSAGGLWDYFGPLVAYARRRSNSNDYEDLLHDALKRVLEVLPTPRGAFAERAWHSFCRRELSEAWREKYGRRGERLPKEDSFEDEGDDQNGDFLPGGLRSRFPQSNFRREQVELIEETALNVVSELPSEFLREVASRAWFQNGRPKHSGAKKSGGDEMPLTAQFPGKSRFQIMRAVRYADAQLAAALLAEPILELDRDWQAVLEALKAASPRPPRCAKERKP